jgi:RimJ/RimL family protein N-acetyltransferase
MRSRSRVFSSMYERSRHSCSRGDRCLRACEVGISLREDARGKRYGREALALLTDRLFDQAGAERVEAPTDPDNVPMHTVFERLGWQLVRTLNEFDREWVMYAIPRPTWEVRRNSE